MSGSITNLPTLKAELRKLGVRIEDAHLSTQRAAKDVIEGWITCGTLLLEAKRKVRHGDWLPWLEANTSIGARQAQKYILVAKNPEKLANANLNAHLTLDRAVGLLAEQKAPPAPRKPIEVDVEDVPEDVVVEVSDGVFEMATPASAREEEQQDDPDAVEKAAADRFVAHLAKRAEAFAENVGVDYADAVISADDQVEKVDKRQATTKAALRAELERKRQNLQCTVRDINYSVFVEHCLDLPEQERLDQVLKLAADLGVAHLIGGAT